MALNKDYLVKKRNSFNCNKKFHYFLLHWSCLGPKISYKEKRKRDRVTGRISGKKRTKVKNFAVSTKFLKRSWNKNKKL